jgi:uncharacterized protein (DUF305 family)
MSMPPGEKMAGDGDGAKFMQAMNGTMKKMDAEMSAAPMNGNVDHDFVAMMIPHHQGAVDMAKEELQYGKDPAMRHLAEEIISGQKVEIRTMKDWLKQHDAK